MAKVSILAIFLFALVAPSYSHGQGAEGHPAPTDKQITACKQNIPSQFEAHCENLAVEFYQAKLAQRPEGLGVGLRDPFADLTPFIVDIRKKAFEKAAATEIKNSLEPIGQAILNTTAQVLSTKVAVNQTGATSNTSGSTSLVSKPTTTDLISLAAESGAFTDTVNGNTLTAQANVDGVRRYLLGEPFADMNVTTLDILRHINLSATFNVAQSGTTGVTPSGTATSSTPSIASIILPSNNVSFNSLSVSYSLLKHYDPRSQDFLKSWKKALGDNAPTMASAITNLEKAVHNASPLRVAAGNDPNFLSALDAWKFNAKNDEMNNDFAKFVADYAAFIGAYETALEKNGYNEIYSDILSVNTTLQALAKINDIVLDKARGTPLLTLSYTYATPPGKPATHTATLSGAYVFKQHWNAAQLTGNAEGSWFATLPAGALYGRVKSYQFSGQFDRPIGNSTSPRAIFSLAGYGQYQYSPTVLNITSANLAPGTDIMLSNGSQVLVGTAGWLGVAQAKLAFNIGKGASIPVAVKYSSKTDLLPGRDWKGQFGISYDLSALNALLSGKK